jgi:hypothetical protein
VLTGTPLCSRATARSNGLYLKEPALKLFVTLARLFY